MSEGVCPPFVATGGHDVSCRDDYSDSMTSSTRASVQVLKTDLHVAVAQARRLEILTDLARSTAAQQRCAALSRKVKLWRARSQVSRRDRSKIETCIVVIVVYPVFGLCFQGIDY